MPASRAKIDFAFDHIIECPRPEADRRISATGLVLLGLLAIVAAATLFGRDPSAPASYNTAQATISPER